MIFVENKVGADVVVVVVVDGCTKLETLKKIFFNS